MIMYTRDSILCSHYNCIRDIFNGKGENVTQSNIEAKSFNTQGMTKGAKFARHK